MLPSVAGLRQISQTGQQTSFAWNSDAEADVFDITVDGDAIGTAATPSAMVTAAPGSHIVGVSPVANPTPEVTMDFAVTVVQPPPPPPPPPPTTSEFPTVAVVAGGGLALLLLIGIGVSVKGKHPSLSKDDALG